MELEFYRSNNVVVRQRIEAQRRVIDAIFNSAIWVPYVENYYPKAFKTKF
jgi:hypothetical protein